MGRKYNIIQSIFAVSTPLVCITPVLEDVNVLSGETDLPTLEAEGAALVPDGGMCLITRYTV